MTTALSPLRVLKAQADKIAQQIAAAERGEPLPDVRFAAKLREARAKKESVVVGVVMDDKLLKITLPWATIRDCGEVALSAYILRAMREEREH